MTELELVTPEATEGTIGDDRIFLMVGGEEFRCRRVAVTWQLMKFAKKQREAKISIPSGLAADDPKRKELEERRNTAGMELLGIMYDTIMILVAPDERDRFERFMETATLMPNELEAAIGDVISRIGNTGDDSGKKQGTSSHSSASEANTSENARVISLAPVTREDAVPVGS